MKSNTKFPTPLFSSFISNFLKLKPWKIAIFLLTLTFLPLSCKQDIDPITAEALMLQQAQEMFKTSSSARITGGSDNDLNMNEHKPDWNIKAFSKNSKKHDILNVLLKQNHNTYMQLCFIYEDGKPTMYVKSYTRDDNSLTIYSGEGKYIEKGLYDQKTGLYGRYWTKSDVAKKGRIADDPEINGGMCPEVTVYGNNSTTSSQWLPTVTMGIYSSGSNTDPNSGGNPNPNGNYNPGNGYSAGTALTYDDYLNDSQHQAFLMSLNDAEKAFLRAYPFLIVTIHNNSTIAANKADALYFGVNVDSNGNAFKHAFFSAINTFYIGVTRAREFGNAHEAGQTNTASQMDLHNNEVGLSIGLNSNSNYYAIEQQAISAVTNGTCRRLSDLTDHNSPMIPTNGDFRK